jgi:hypothetical protein
VDGAKNPEKIPMELAYRHFIRALAGPLAAEDETNDIIDRRRYHAKRMGLSSVDEAALTAAVKGLGDELEAIDLARRRGSADPLNITVDLHALRVQERDFLDSARQRMRLALSAEAVAQLERYVQEHVRKRITIYGELPQ